MKKEEFYILCCLTLKERELYALTKHVTSLADLEVVIRPLSQEEGIKRAREIYLEMEKRGIKVTSFFDEDYPAVLKDIPFFPPFLFYIGHYESDDENAVAIVGSRKATLRGVQLAEELVKELSSYPVTIVSGLAAGIDTVSHKKALELGLRTIAVLGSGIDVVYPAENRELYNKIAERGVVFSEYLPKTPPYAYNFPKRNRIISGLSKAVVVVEAGEKSGSLITARYAMEQNRELYVFPRTPLERNSEGNNNLIKLGARVLTKGREILEEVFHYKIKEGGERVEVALTKEEARVLDCIGEEPVNIDTLCFLLDMGPSTLANFLLILEIKGLVKELPGKFYVRQKER